MSAGLRAELIPTFACFSVPTAEQICSGLDLSCYLPDLKIACLTPCYARQLFRLCLPAVRRPEQAECSFMLQGLQHSMHVVLGSTLGGRGRVGVLRQTFAFRAYCTVCTNDLHACRNSM